MAFANIRLPATADMHVHLRDGKMMEQVTPLIRQGGVDAVFVMPNLQPPITTSAAAAEYRKKLEALAPGVAFLMSLYLNDSITPETIRTAQGISGVKVYPAGVTTNSAGGVVDLEKFFPVFAAMEEGDIVLNLHGEVVNSSVLTAESEFLPTLVKIHNAFPQLRIVLEHCTTRDAVEAVKRCGPTVAATITAHHLYLTVDDWCGDGLNFCKPVAKSPADRDALLQAITHEKFLFGSDSAPHPLAAKMPSSGKSAAGVFTQPFATQLVVLALEEGMKRGVVDVSVDQLRAFLSERGRKFYRLPAASGDFELSGSVTIPDIVGDIPVAVSRAGTAVYDLKWL